MKLKRLERLSRLPPHILEVLMPRYWKRNARRELRIIVRNDCCRLKNGFLHFPKALKLRYKGKLKWKGKQGRLEIIYDDVDEVWRALWQLRLRSLPEEETTSPST